MELALVKICFCMEKKPNEQPDGHHGLNGGATLF
jgi:hypothetical protein